MTLWMYVGSLVLLVIVVAYFAVLNARTIIRDLNRAFDRFQSRLDSDANAIVDRLFAATPSESAHPAPETGDKRQQ